MIRRILDSLSYRIDRQLAETLYQTQVYQDQRWNSVERFVIEISTQPYHSALKLALAFVGLSFALFMNSDFLREQLDVNIAAWYIGHAPTPVSVQATLLGVIYPLVVGLVSILLQQKSEAAALWTLYVRYSGFMFAGLSGLLLIGVDFGAQLIEPLTPPALEVAWSIFSVLWLLFNLLLTAWFLRSTALVIFDRTRSKLLLRFTINNAFEGDIRKRLPRHMAMAETFGGLAGHVTRRLMAGDEPDQLLVVDTTGLTPVGGTLVYRKTRKKTYIQDIHYRVVSCALWIIQRRLAQQGPSFERSLVLPLSIDAQPSHKHLVADYRGFQPDWLSKNLLKLAFPTTPRNPFPENALPDVQRAITGAVRDALKVNDLHAYHEAVSHLVDWHTHLLDYLAFTNDKGQPDNWLLLPAPGLTVENYLHTYLGEYHDLVREAIRKMPVQQDYFLKICHLHPKLVPEGQQFPAKEVVGETLYAHHLAWQLLVKWRAQYGHSSPLTNAAYEEALLEYVGAWESWDFTLSSAPAWTTSLDSLVPTLEHLQCTARQIIIATLYEDQLAVEWAADMLNAWLDNLFPRHVRMGYQGRRELIVHSLLEGAPGGMVWNSILGGTEYDQAQAVGCAMENAWEDMRLLTAAYLLSRKNEDASEDLGIIIRGLLSGRRFKHTDDPARGQRREITAEGIVFCYIRLRSYWGQGEGSYRTWADSVVYEFNEVESPQWVPGRVYSGERQGVNSLVKAYVRLAVDYSEHPWNIDDRLLSHLSTEVLSHEALQILFRDMDEWEKIAGWLRRDGAVQPDRVMNLVNALQSARQTLET